MIVDVGADGGPVLDGRRYVIDTSAAVSSRRRRLPHLWSVATSNGQLLATPPLLHELLLTAVNRRDFDEMEDELLQLPMARFPGSVWATARTALRELAAMQSGYHRISLADVLIAAAAQENGAGVLHYDHHFDRLADVLAFESRWIAPPGSL